MNYVITQNKQIGIDADTPEAAILGILNGGGDTLNISFSTGVRSPAPGVVGGATSRGPLPQMVASPTTTTTQPTPS